MSLYGKPAATGTVKYHTIPMVTHNLKRLWYSSVYKDLGNKFNKVDIGVIAKNEKNTLGLISKSTSS